MLSDGSDVPPLASRAISAEHLRESLTPLQRDKCDDSEVAVNQRSVHCATTDALHLLHRLIDGERGRLLARREILERLHELAHDHRGRHHDIAALKQPLVVSVRCDVRSLERVHP